MSFFFSSICVGWWTLLFKYNGKLNLFVTFLCLLLLDISKNNSEMKKLLLSVCSLVLVFVSGCDKIEDKIVDVNLETPKIGFSFMEGTLPKDLLISSWNFENGIRAETNGRYGLRSVKSLKLTSCILELRDFSENDFSAAESLRIEIVNPLDPIGLDNRVIAELTDGFDAGKQTISIPIKGDLELIQYLLVGGSTVLKLYGKNRKDTEGVSCMMSIKYVVKVGP